VEIVEEGESACLRLNLGTDPEKAATRLVDSAVLGKAKVSGLGYEGADGLPVLIGTDFFGRKRSQTRPFPGPFEAPGRGDLSLRPWYGKEPFFRRRDRGPPASRFFLSYLVGHGAQGAVIRFRHRHYQWRDRVFAPALPLGGSRNRDRSE